MIHSKITHCKFPDCWERRRKGAEERGLLRAPSRGHPGPEWRPAGRAESSSQFWLRWPHQEASVSTPGNLRAPPAPPPAPGSGSPSPPPLPRAGPPPSRALRLGCLPGRWLAAEHGSIRPPQPTRHGCERGAVQQSHPAEEPPAAPRDHQAWIGAGRAAVHGLPQSPRVSGQARCPGDPSCPTRPALGFAPARLPCPAGGALPAAHDLLGAGWARGRPGTRLLPEGGAGEGAAPERLGRGLAGHAYDEACLRARDASGRGHRVRVPGTAAGARPPRVLLSRSLPGLPEVSSAEPPGEAGPHGGFGHALGPERRPGWRIHC